MKKLILTSFFIIIFFASCDSTKNIWHKNGYCDFFKRNKITYKTDEPLAVFVDWNDNFHIFNQLTQEHICTKSATKFISNLSRMCHNDYFERIAILTFCSGYTKHSKIFDTLNDSALVQFVDYKKTDNFTYYQIKPLESPSSVLNFCFSPDFMYCDCASY